MSEMAPWWETKRATHKIYLSEVVDAVGRCEKRQALRHSVGRQPLRSHTTRQDGADRLHTSVKELEEEQPW